MRLSFAQDRLLAVMAHPDDAELLCAGTLARAKSDGAAIGICVMCDGDKGTPRGPEIKNLADIRRAEAHAAAALLGAELHWFGSADGDLMDGVPQRRKIVEILRRFRPTLVLSHSPEDYHPDHRAASVLAEAATWFCASVGQVTESPALDAPPVLWFADTLGGNGFSPEFFIDVSAHVELKKQMLACHRSQLDRGQDSDFAPLTDQMLQQCLARGNQSNTAAAEAFRSHQAFKRVSAI